MTLFRLFPDSLTSAIRHLSIADRIETRRRIEAVADHWALVLKARYGNDAIGICRRKMANCARYSPGVRWTIWTKVYQRLYPHAIRKDRGKAR